MMLVIETVKFVNPTPTQPAQNQVKTVLVGNTFFLPFFYVETYVFVGRLAFWWVYFVMYGGFNISFLFFSTTEILRW